ncbi:MAG: hypothetical protein OFPII_23650 [Osedax symbiont Rs1]|nr:MAG: hypothetical protein OFPII_23650 [Osedax symbiont Rs1]
MHLFRDYKKHMSLQLRTFNHAAESRACTMYCSEITDSGLSYKFRQYLSQ